MVQKAAAEQSIIVNGVTIRFPLISCDWWATLTALGVPASKGLWQSMSQCERFSHNVQWWENQIRFPPCSRLAVGRKYKSMATLTGKRDSCWPVNLAIWTLTAISCSMNLCYHKENTFKGHIVSSTHSAIHICTYLFGWPDFQRGTYC